MSVTFPGNGGSTLEWAKYYKSIGWRPIPVPYCEKRPRIPDWTNLHIAEADLPKFFDTQTNIGIVLGEASDGLADVDCDCDETVKLAPFFLPSTDWTHGRKSRPQSHWFYQVNSTTKYKKYRDPDDGRTLLELRYGSGLQTIVPCSTHPSGEQVLWSGNRDGKPAGLDAQKLGVNVDRLASCALTARHWAPRGSRQELALALSGFLLQAGMQEEDVRVFVAAAAIGAGDEEARKRQETVGSTAGKIQRGENVTGAPRLEQLLRGDGRKIIGKIKEWLGFKGNRDTQSYPRTDLDNGEYFVSRHGDEVRFNHFRRTWYVWNAGRWKPDDDGEVIRRGKETIKSLSDTASPMNVEAWNHALRSQSEAKLKSMINMAQSEPRVAITDNQFDRDTWLLNVINGTINLRTGELYPHRQSDLITKLVPVTYDKKAECRTWVNFLDKIMDGNTELITYLQRAIGYSLTGETSEQVLFLFQGDGKNGKSTLLNCILKMLGDYATQGVPTLLIAKKYESHPTEVAELNGSRFVPIIMDAQEGVKLDEGRVKYLTGSDPLKARHMREDFFQFDPTSKLFVSINNKPTITGTDTAIWRRIKTIPFGVTISESERDKILPERLKAEFPGILNWALKGCLDWQQKGLGEPAAVNEATNDYRKEMDLVGLFLSECVIPRVGSRVQVQRVYQRYQRWCQESGEWHPLTRAQLSKKMTAHGYVNQKGAGNRFYWIDVDLQI